MKLPIIILLFAFQQSVLGQFQIENPIPIVYQDNIDSNRLNFSKFCTGNSIFESKKSTDIRIYRIQAFGDMKLIRIYNNKKHTLAIEVYSSLPYKDSLLFHKKFGSKRLDNEIRALIKGLDPLNLPNLDYDYISSKQMPRVNDGNWYFIETKIKNTFSYQEFNNPEIYAKYFPGQSIQAMPFTEFVKGIEKLTGINIIDIEIPIRQ